MSNWLHALVTPSALPVPGDEIPRRFQPYGLDDIPQPTLRTLVERYGRSFWDVAPLGIAPVLFGVSGTFKTTSAAVLAHAISEVFRLELRWFNCGAEVKTLDRLAFKASTSDRVAQLKRAPFLIMDDILQASAGRQMDMVLEIGNDRFDALRPTLYTANVTVTKDDRQALDDAVGVGFARRLMDSGRGFTAMVKPLP